MWLRALSLFLLGAPAVAATLLPAPTAGAPITFPEGFLWGTATAAVQVEGDTPDSDWASFQLRPGAIRGGDRIGRAARHWDQYEQDFQQAAAMHTNAYRFSIEWSRLEPRPGEWNEAAEAHYRRMLASLRAKGIRPMVTLHHFSNPQWVADQGGWANPATVDDFERFVIRAAEAFGAQVDDWITFNEPTIYACEGYVRGTFPPGVVGDLTTLPHVLSNLVTAHGRAYRALHQVDTVAATPGSPPARVGVAEHMVAFYPSSSWNPLDQLWTGISEAWINYGFLDSAWTGRLRFETGAGRDWRDLPWMEGSLDFVGVNYYTRSVVSVLTPLARNSAPGAAQSDLGLEIYPAGLGEVLARTHARYKLPIVITETGIADASRQATPAFMVRHLAEVGRAMQRGVPVEGIFWWSLLDNFEWQNGYHGRFGLLAVDFDDQRTPRTWTPAARLYAQIAGARGIAPELLARYDTEAPYAAVRKLAPGQSSR